MTPRESVRLAAGAEGEDGFDTKGSGLGTKRRRSGEKESASRVLGALGEIARADVGGGQERGQVFGALGAEFGEAAAGGQDAGLE